MRAGKWRRIGTGFHIDASEVLRRLLGAMVLSESKEITHSGFSASGIDSGTDSQHASKAVGFVGVSATAGLGKHFGLVGSAKLTSDPAYSQVGLGVALLF